MVPLNVSIMEREMAVTKKIIVISSNTSWYIYNFKLNLLKILASQGYKINVIAPRDPYSDELKKFGFKYHEIKINSKELIHSKILSYYTGIINCISKYHLMLFYSILSNQIFMVPWQLEY